MSGSHVTITSSAAAAVLIRFTFAVILGVATLLLPPAGVQADPSTARQVHSFPYVAEAVTFANGDVMLAGTLTLPMRPGPHPAVVLMSGSGPNDRIEDLLSGFPIFFIIADHLSREGFAVLHYDDRGVGQSTGHFESADIRDFASDAKAAVTYLKTRGEIDRSEIGVLGHSEGGLYAAQLGADRDSGVAFIVSLAGPAVSGEEVVLRQSELILRAEGAPDGLIEAQLSFLRASKSFLATRDWVGLERLAYETALVQWQFLTPLDKLILGGDAEAFAREQAAGAVAAISSDWYRSLIEYNPASDWARVRVPVLALFGDRDVQVEAAQSAGPLQDQLLTAGNPDFEVRSFPKANHLFQAAISGGLSEYAFLPPVFTPELLPAISRWLAQHVTFEE